MKKIAKFLATAVVAVVTLVAVSSVVGAAPSTVTFTRPSFDIVINGYIIEPDDNMHREYPFYVYNNITYFPMTYDDCATLGVRNDWTSYSGNHITYGYECADYKPAYSYQAKPMTATAHIAGDFTTPNGRLYNSYEQYPIYTCNNVLYFPMTWAWTSTFGWTNTFVDNTLYITADVDYCPISLANRVVDLDPYGKSLLGYDVVNNTGNALSGWRIDFAFYDKYGNRFLTNDGDDVFVVKSTNYVAPYSVLNDRAVDLTSDLRGKSVSNVRFEVKIVVFADGTAWIKPRLS